MNKKKLSNEISEIKWKIFERESDRQQEKDIEENQLNYFVVFFFVEIKYEFTNRF